MPGNSQALINLIAAYVGVTGAQTFNGLNYGANTPTPDNRDKPWFKTDQLGNPIGFFSWNGLTWSAIPIVVGNGTTGMRPSNPGVGTEYFDTTIGVLLLYNGTIWTTASGSPGDVKEVKAPDITTALTVNPGWIQDTASIGLVIGGAGDATGITVAHPYGTVIGEETHQIAISELPAHTHTVPSGNGGVTADGNTGNPAGIIPDRNTVTSSSTGSNQAMNVIQPTAYYWRLVKQS